MTTLTRPPDPRETLTVARETTRRHAKTFSLACRLLPRRVRGDVYLLYLVFRTLDDLVDEERPEASARVAAVAAWAAGEPAPATEEVTVLEALDRRHTLPRDAIGDFCEGMEQDLRRAAFATEADLDAYCYRVAGTVGIVMSAVLGTRNAVAARPAAAALGMAMQRTNILRDIDEDHDAGRQFVSQDAVERFGAPRPGHREALLRSQITRADALYDEGLRGVAELLSGRRSIAAAAAMYREILREIERTGYGRLAGRAVVSGRRKLWVALRAALRSPS